jgi:hypothetical protein
MEKLNTKKAVYIKVMSIFISLIASFVFIMPVLSVGTTLDKDLSIQEIISKAEMRQQAIKDNIRDATFMGKAVYKELDKDGSIKKDVIINRRVYTKQDGKRYEEYISMLVNGKQLTKEEVEKEKKELQKKNGSGEMKMPLSKEAKNDYEYKLIGSSIFNGLPVWIIEFTSKKKEDGYINGKGYILKDKYDIIHAEFAPAKVSSVVRDLNMSLSYCEVQGYWLPSKFEMDLKVNVKFVLSMYYKQIKVEDVYTQYKLNSGLQDSFFESKG